MLISIFILCNNKETFQSKSDNQIFKEIMINYLLYIQKYIGLMREIYLVYIVIIQFLEYHTTIDVINNDIGKLKYNLLRIYTLHENINKLEYTQNFKNSKYKEFQLKLNDNYNEIKKNKKNIYEYYNGNGIENCKEIKINNTQINNLFSKFKNKDPLSTISSNYNEIDFDNLNIKLASYNKKKISEFFSNADTIKTTLNNDNLFFNFLKNNLIDIHCVKSSSSPLPSADLKKTLKTFQNISSKLISYKKELDAILIVMNNPGMLIDEDADKNFFETTNKNQLIEHKFCEKLKKLDKPNKQNLIFKRFSQDIIDKKKKYIIKMEEKIKKLHDEQTNNEVYNTNIDRLYSHIVSKKKYDAIVKGIDNIKNKNKVKINLI